LPATGRETGRQPTETRTSCTSRATAMRPRLEAENGPGRRRGPAIRARPRPLLPRESDALDASAGLLAPGSPYSRTFPPVRPRGSATGSGSFRFRPRLQWRGPRRRSTGFPLTDPAYGARTPTRWSPRHLVYQRKRRGLRTAGWRRSPAGHPCPPLPVRRTARRSSPSPGPAATGSSRPGPARDRPDRQPRRPDPQDR